MNKTNQVLLIVWLVAAAFMGYLLASLVGSRHATEQKTRDEALSYARLVAQHASGAFDRANAAIGSAVDHLVPSDFDDSRPLTQARLRELEAMLRAEQQRAAGIITLFITGPRGRIRAISLGASPATDLSDRDYFRALKSESRSGTIISEVVYGRVSRQWGTMVARRIDAPDGSFAGMVAANLGLDRNFTDFYATLSLGEHSTVSLRDDSNRLLVRYPAAESRLGRPLESDPVSERISAGDSHGVVVGRSSIDGMERVSGFRRIDNYPIYAYVGLSREDSLATWRRDRNIGIVAALVVVFAAGLITLMLKRNAEADAEIRRLNEGLEARVKDRTDELMLANRRLIDEMAERKRAEASALKYADRLAMFSRRTVGILEEERRRLGREIHDRISSSLTAIGINLQTISAQLSGEQRERLGGTLSDCAALAEDASASARDISSDLHPAILDYAGIVAALRELGEKFAIRAAIRVGVRGPEQRPSISTEREIALFRIAQEALVNCIKHAHASEVSIGVEVQADRITMTVSDNGTGFDPEEARAASHSPGLGLLSMQERAEAVGGSCRVESNPGRGTRVMVEVPL